MFRHSLVWVVLLGAATPGWASWADGMFDAQARDFGSVPHGHIATHPFRLVNRTGSTVHISNVRVSCGCTTAQALQYTLAPGKDTAILVQMDTRRFYGIRAVTVYVQFDQPEFDEVRLRIQADSRDDVSVLPESFGFGQIKPGKAAKGNVTVSFLGDANFQITNARCDSNYIQLDYEETQRDAGEVAYRVTARLRPDIPAGTWYTDVWLATNNATMPRLRVPLTVEVVAPAPKAAPAAKVTGQTVALGTVKAGEESERTVVLRSARPFRVTAITGNDDELRVRDPSSDSRAVHTLTITVHPEHSGTLTRSIRVRTDLPASDEIEIKATANVVP
jgi:hypothetical protein